MRCQDKTCFSVNVSKKATQKFKDKCRQDGFDIGAVIQAYMEKYSEGKIKLRFSKTENGFAYEITDVIKD